MSKTSDIVEVAREISARHGAKAAAKAMKWADRHRQVGETEGAIFWDQVAETARALHNHRMPAKVEAPRWDFRHAFEATPHPYLLLTPKLDIAGANDAYLAATMTRRSDILGCALFDVFPDNPATPEADGVRNLSASLARVLSSGQAHRMERQRYDIRRPDGSFEERWWQPLNRPAFNDDGELALIIHHVEDITASVRA